MYTSKTLQSVLRLAIRIYDLLNLVCIYGLDCYVRTNHCGTMCNGFGVRTLFLSAFSIDFASLLAMNGASYVWK